MIFNTVTGDPSENLETFNERKKVLRCKLSLKSSFHAPRNPALDLSTLELIRNMRFFTLFFNTDRTDILVTVPATIELVLCVVSSMC